MKREKGSTFTQVGDYSLHITGNVESDTPIAVSGIIDGDITVVAAAVKILEDCEVNGNIKAAEVIVEGKVNGNIISTFTTLCETADVHGNIDTTTVCIHNGAHMNGNCKTANDRPSTN